MPKQDVSRYANVDNGIRYAILPPGLTPSLDALLTQDNVLLLFKTVDEAKEYLAISKRVPNPDYFQIITVDLAIGQLCIVK